MKTLEQMFSEAIRCQRLKDLVWLIYSEPAKVEKAIEALNKIVEGKD